MMFVLGIIAFALCILVSVALHECGHMWVARATGMKVRRYFVGFGPTLWSTRRPNKLGDTEYGVKAIPLGGFCDIAGMTTVDELAPEDERVRDVQAEDVEARRRARRGPRHEFHHRAGPDLRHRGHLGAAQSASAHDRDGRRNLLCEIRSHQGRVGRLPGALAGSGRRDPGRRRRRQGRRHPGGQLRRDGFSGTQARRADPTHRAARRRRVHHRGRRHFGAALDQEGRV